jgi:hypothetical protein
MSNKNPTDTVIEQAARAIIDRYPSFDLISAAGIARALHDAGLLADPADRDEEGLQTRLDISVIAAKTFRARAERAETERDELRSQLQSARRQRDEERAAKEGNWKALGEWSARAERAEAERDELRSHGGAV